jgi:predicted methyltransferase
MDTGMIVLSWFQIEVAITAHRAGQTTASISLDLNRTTTEVGVSEQGIIFPDGQTLDWSTAERIAEAKNRCYVLENGAAREIQTFSEVTNWARSLMPTEGAPTVLVSGTPMHRISGVDPHKDTLLKVKTLKPIHGAVLDTATGLGYTAIEAGRTADRVVTVELDPAALEIARYNPWSQELFTNPRIEQIVGDVFDVVEDTDYEAYSCIIHDPPMFSLAGDLYSGDFYRELYRILRHRGRLFHYVGDLDSKSGHGVVKGVVRRLQEAGFSRIQRRPEAFGLLVTK